MTNLNYKPTEQDKVILNLFYNRFYDLFDEIVSDKFVKYSAAIRFSKLKEAFAIYKELLYYPPIREYIKWMKAGGRPYFEGIIADDLFSFIRNLLMHFPIFNTWDEVYITKDMATWGKSGQIDKFLKNCTDYKIDGKGKIKYRMWDEIKQKMTYFEVNFPEIYDNNNIFLKNIISENVGMKFCMVLMREILDKQISNPDRPAIKVMSQLYYPSTKK